MADDDTQDDQNEDVDQDGTPDDDQDAQRLLADAVDSDDDTGQQPADTSKDQDRGDSGQLGDAGKKALDAMKRERNQARKELQAAQQRLKEYDDANKSETQRLQEAAEDYKTRLAEAESTLRRRQVAEDRAPEHATMTQIKAVAKRLQGESDEDLETDADELFGLLAPKPAEPPARVPSRPAERMPRGGGDPDEPPEETDPKKLAAMIPRGGR